MKKRLERVLNMYLEVEKNYETIIRKLEPIGIYLDCDYDNENSLGIDLGNYSKIARDFCKEEFKDENLLDIFISDEFGKILYDYYCGDSDKESVLKRADTMLQSNKLK